MNIQKQTLYLFLFLEVLLAPFLLKIYNLYNGFNSEYIKIFQIIAHDSIILCSIIFFSYISYIVSNRTIGILLRLIALFIYIIYLTDYIILSLFATHLTYNDIIKFISYVPKFISQELNIDFIVIILALLSLVIIYLFLSYKFKINKKRNHMIIISSIIILVILNQFATNGSYIHSWIYKNVVEYNLEIRSQSQEYSKEFIDSLNYNEKTKTKIYKTDKQPNIIILMVESLSSYQSKLFSGIKNWTPNIDKIAKDNIYFTNFYANGFVTEDAEVSILTGLLPLYAPKIFSNGGGVAFKGFFDYKKSLPNIFKQYGYNTEFITTSDLNFSNTGKWAKSIGFDYIEGSEFKGYEGLPRFHFHSVPDKYLYQRVVSRVSNQKDKFLIFIKTVSSHVPFINPITKHRSEKEVIQYVDKQVAIFYKNLLKTDFFNNGVLIIVGDHHPTMPVKQEAIDKFGIYKASAMIPMIISYGDRLKKHITKPFSQIDIYHSLVTYTTNKITVSNWIGNFIDPNLLISPKYILHKRADRRGVISIFENKQVYNVMLGGDDTKFLNKTNNDKQEILDKINYERIQKVLD